MVKSFKSLMLIYVNATTKKLTFHEYTLAQKKVITLDE